MVIRHRVVEPARALDELCEHVGALRRVGRFRVMKMKAGRRLGNGAKAARLKALDGCSGELPGSPHMAAWCSTTSAERPLTRRTSPSSGLV